MTLATPGVLAPASFVTPPNVDHLLDAPLPQLLDELGVLLVDSSITDSGFVGAVVQRRDGQLILSMPVGRPEVERDTAARMLLAEALGVRGAPVSEPLRMEVSA